MVNLRMRSTYGAFKKVVSCYASNLQEDVAFSIHIKKIVVLSWVISNRT